MKGLPIYMWFKELLVSHLLKLRSHAKWFRIDHDVNHNDFVLFLRQNGALSNTYHYSKINEVVPRKNGIICKALLRHRNQQERW